MTFDQACVMFDPARVAFARGSRAWNGPLASAGDAGYRAYAIL